MAKTTPIEETHDTVHTAAKRLGCTKQTIKNALANPKYAPMFEGQTAELPIPGMPDQYLLWISKAALDEWHNRASANRTSGLRGGKATHGRFYKVRIPNDQIDAIKSAYPNLDFRLAFTGKKATANNGTASTPVESNTVLELIEA